MAYLRILNVFNYFLKFYFSTNTYFNNIVYIAYYFHLDKQRGRFQAR